MKPEVLERLLIDRAAGALPPDVAALVGAYLERAPEQSPRAQEIDDCVRLAKLALPRPLELPLPALKVSQFPKTQQRKGFARAWWPAEIAAALVLGIGLGWWAERAQQPISLAPVRATNLAQNQTTNSPPAFWSQKRLASIGWKAGPVMAPRFTWKILVQNSNSKD